MAEFSINNVDYVSDKIDAMRQFSIMKKLSPVVGALASIVQSGKFDMASVIAPLSEAIAKIPDEETTFILATCLGVTSRVPSGGVGAVAIWNASAKRPMYDDIDLSVMLRIAAEVLKDNFASFFTGPPLASPEHGVH